MRGDLANDPYKLAHTFQQVEAGWIVSVYGPSGHGVIKTDPEACIGAAVKRAEEGINAIPSLKGYHL